MLKAIYSFLQKKVGQVERDLYDISKQKDSKSMSYNVYFAKLFAYLSIGIRYLFYGILEFVVKFFVLILKDPHEGYKILTAPIEKIEAKEEELLKSEHFERFKRVHKKTRLASFATLLGSSVAVLAISFLISFVSPERQDTFAASYTWTQSDWTGGATSNTASDPANRTGWTEYTSTTTGMIATTSVSLLATPQNFIDSTNPTRPTGTSGGDFDLGTNNNTAITSNGSIKLASVKTFLSPEIYTQIADIPNGVDLSPSPHMVAVGNYLYSFANNGGFYRYDINTNQWQAMATPSFTGGGSVGTGSFLAYPGSGDFIYAGRGSSSIEFSKYSISNNTWTTLANIPFSISNGTSAIGAGGYIYVQGGGNKFARYSPSSNSWSYLANFPYAVSWGNGNKLTYDGNDYIYAIASSYTSRFYRYSISTNTWTTLANLPFTLDYDAGIAYITGTDYIYLIRASDTSSFYRYSISTNTWEAREPLPKITNHARYRARYGASIVYPGSGNYVYLLTGSTSVSTPISRFYKVQIID